MNRLLLDASLLERSATRYTPAGLPAVDVKLGHESEVSEDGHPRKVSLELRAVGMGEITRQLLQLPLGQITSFAGFLAMGRNGKGVVFHVTEIVAGT